MRETLLAPNPIGDASSHTLLAFAPLLRLSQATVGRQRYQELTFLYQYGMLPSFTVIRLRVRRTRHRLSLNRLRSIFPLGLSP